MSDADKVCKWIADKVKEGRGAVVFALEENAGYVGVFWAGEDERPALGVGEDAIGAVLDAIGKEAAEHRLQADLPIGSPEFPCLACTGAFYHFPGCPTRQTAKA